MAFLPIFHSPFHQAVQVNLHPFQQIAFQPAYVHVTMHKPIEYVGCVIIANTRLGGPHGHDVIMPFSHTKNAYDVLGGDISGYDDPLKCINTLMTQFKIAIGSHTKYVDVQNDSNGKLCRIYIVRLKDISVTDLTSKIVYNPVISGAYAHLNRFPMSASTNTHTNVDSNGKPQAFLSFASKVMQIAKQN